MHDTCSFTPRIATFFFTLKRMLKIGKRQKAKGAGNITSTDARRTVL